MVNTNKLIRIENTIINLAAIEQVCINYNVHYGEEWYEEFREECGIKVFYMNRPEGQCPYDIFESITIDEFWSMLNENTKRN